MGFFAYLCTRKTTLEGICIFEGRVFPLSLLGGSRFSCFEGGALRGGFGHIE